MSELGQVIGYLADLAGLASPRSERNVDDLVWLGWSSRVDRLQLGDATGIRRLYTADRLAADEHLLRQGWIWLAGTFPDGSGGAPVEHLVPILRRRVRVVRQQTEAGTVAYSVEGLEEWWVTTGLMSDEAADSLAAKDDIDWGVSVTPATSPALPRHPRLGLLLRELAGALGHAGAAISLDPPSEAMAATTPQLVLGTGIYIDHNPLEMDRRTTLLSWQRHRLEGTALDAVYGEVEPAPPGPPRRLRSPLPLNAAQRRVVLDTTAAPLTVVAGPPGTGKTHLVAAAAMDAVGHGQSVLIASQSLHACDAVAEVLARYPMVGALRFGQEQPSRELGDRLGAGVAPPDAHFDARTQGERLDQLAAQLDQLHAEMTARLGRVAAAESARPDLPLWFVGRSSDDLDLAELIDARHALNAEGLFRRLRQRRGRRRLRALLGAPAVSPTDELIRVVAAVEADRYLLQVSDDVANLGDQWGDVEQLQDAWRTVAGDYLEAVRRERANRSTRSSLAELATALRTGGRARRQHLLEMSDHFLEVVPLWLGTLGDIEATLPVRPGMFDLVILDEASQISQINAAPALARAKRALVVGDPRQLRHLSFVPDAAQAAAAADHQLDLDQARQLDERRNSLFDAAAVAAPVTSLNEHFRSVPHLIGFSARRFYDGSLKLMTQHPATESVDAIRILRVEGERNQANVVEAEVRVVVAETRRVVDAGVRSVGILSPFRAQVDALTAAVTEEFTIEEIERHELRVGTVHRFQGCERDVVLISLGLGPESSSALAFVEDPTLFNVMVTRARSEVVVVTALPPGGLRPGLLADYLRYGDQPPPALAVGAPNRGWVGELAKELSAIGDLRVVADYPVAGWTVDLAVGTGRAAFGVETGVHPAGAGAHIERHLALRRAGWTMVTCFRAEWEGRAQEAAAGLAARYARAQASLDEVGHRER
jgi:hypothetical protein